MQFLNERAHFRFASAALVVGFSGLVLCRLLSRRIHWPYAQAFGFACPNNSEWYIPQRCSTIRKVVPFAIIHRRFTILVASYIEYEWSMYNSHHQKKRILEHRLHTRSPCHSIVDQAEWNHQWKARRIIHFFLVTDSRADWQPVCLPRRNMIHGMTPPFKEFWVCPLWFSQLKSM